MHLIADRFDVEDFQAFWTSDPVLGRLRADHGAPAKLLKSFAGGVDPHGRRP